jgi:hypothetical protein
MRDSAGITRVKINPHDGLQMESDVVQGGQTITRETFLRPDRFYSDQNYFAMILKGLPTSSQGLEVGQVYVDNGTLKIKTS